MDRTLVLRRTMCLCSGQIMFLQSILITDIGRSLSRHVSNRWNPRPEQPRSGTCFGSAMGYFSLCESIQSLFINRGRLRRYTISSAAEDVAANALTMCRRGWCGRRINYVPPPRRQTHLSSAATLVPSLSPVTISATGICFGSIVAPF